MKESYNEGVASHIGPESCLDDPREGVGKRWRQKEDVYSGVGGSTGGLLSSENTFFRRPS